MPNTTDTKNSKADREAERKAAGKKEQASIVAGLLLELATDEQILAFTRGRIAGGWKGKLSVGPEAFFAPYVNVCLTERRVILQHIHIRTGKPSEIMAHSFPLPEIVAANFSDIETYGAAAEARLVFRLSQGDHTFRIRLIGATNTAGAQSIAEVFQSLTSAGKTARTSPTQRICMICGQVQDQPSRFCPYCGAPQAEADPAASTPQEPVAVDPPEMQAVPVTMVTSPSSFSTQEEDLSSGGSEQTNGDTIELQHSPPEDVEAPVPGSAEDTVQMPLEEHGADTEREPDFDIPPTAHASDMTWTPGTGASFEPAHVEPLPAPPAADLDTPYESDGITQEENALRDHVFSPDVSTPQARETVFEAPPHEETAPQTARVAIYPVHATLDSSAPNDFADAAGFVIEETVEEQTESAHNTMEAPEPIFLERERAAEQEIFNASPPTTPKAVMPPAAAEVAVPLPPAPPEAFTPSIPAPEASMPPPSAPSVMPSTGHTTRNFNGPLTVKVHINHPKVKVNETFRGSNAEDVVAQLKSRVAREVLFAIRLYINSMSTLSFAQDAVKRYNAAEGKNVPIPGSYKEFLIAFEGLGFATIEEN